MLSMLQVKELQERLNREKSSRTDLEMYVAVLNTQKNVLQEDLDKLRAQLQDGSSDLIHQNYVIISGLGW